LANRLATIYQQIILRYPSLIMLFLVLVCSLTAWKLSDFRLDASADSLVLESDDSLKFYRTMRDRFESSDDFLVITFTPASPLFTEESIALLRQLRDELEALELVTSTNSILSVPLLSSPELRLDNIAEQIKTLDEDQVELGVARDALLTNPLYRSLLISEDAQTTAIQVNLKTDPRFQSLLKERERLREQARSDTVSEQTLQELERVSAEFDVVAATVSAQQNANVAAIRDILSPYRSLAEVHLGGVPMIVSDMIAFVASDLETFGLGVLIFIILTLTIIFRQWQWVLQPLLCCLTTVWIMIGLLGWLQWPVTVISSNFVSLLLIITLSLTVHITVRYREYQQLTHGASRKQLVIDTTSAMFKPCLFMTLTTIVAFGSLLFSGIRPVIDFGKMMTIGIGVAFFVTFLLLPVTIQLLPVSNPPPASNTYSPFTAFLARITEKHGVKIMFGGLLLALFFFVGISRLTVDNRFIDYFKESTEIYQGMVVIDNKIGGTTPLDIIINDIRSEQFASDDPFLDDPFLNDDFSDDDISGGDDSDSGSSADAYANDPFLNDCFDEEDCDETETTEDIRNTWYTYQKMDQLEQVHDYLDSLPESGKVLSVATTLKLVQQINQGDKLDALELAFLPKVFPEDLADLLIHPYISEEYAQARFNLRLVESSANLQRQQLLDQIRSHLTEELGFQDDQIQFTGMTVLYNNMLQSLFDSQIKTLGIVFVAIMCMFLLLFRSLALTLIGMAPNVLAAAAVLGLMGWLKIPLDMMTITVAAITVGIAVDNTIHYIYRFRMEFAKDGDYYATMHRCHNSIGRAMFYTSVTIIIGFSILVLSNFIPTIYFGLFTGMAMLVALIGSLTLLPQLIIWFKPRL